MAHNLQRPLMTVTSRLHTYTYLLRLPQILLSLAIFALAITNARDFQNMSCAIPRNIELPIICAALSLITLPYLVLFSPPLSRYRLLNRSPLVPAVLDTLFTLVYLVTTYYVAAPQAVCASICTACGSLWEEIDGCTCHIDDYRGEEYTPISRVPSLSSGVTSGDSLARYTRRRRMSAIGWMGVVLVVLFLGTAAVFAMRVLEERREVGKKRVGALKRQTTMTPVEEGEDEMGFEMEVEKRWDGKGARSGTSAVSEL